MGAARDRISTTPPDEPSESFVAGVFPRSGTASERPQRTGRRLAVGRLVAVLLAVVIALAVLFTLGGQVARESLAWLGGRSSYQVPFASIRLDPPPPPWIRSGATGLLDRVRRRSNRPETFALLDLDLAALAGDFMRESPWIRAVSRISVTRGREVVVHLDYRVPVAALPLAGGRRLVLDRDAVVLPLDDLDASQAGSLVLLVGMVPDGSTVVPLPGRKPILERSDVPGPAATDALPALVRAAAIAAFLRDQAATTRPALAVTAIHQTPDALFVEASGSMIRWCALPGREPPGDLADPERWRLLAEWLDQNKIESIRAPLRGYLDFDRHHAVVKKY